MSSEKRKIAYIDGKPYEIGSKHTSILKFVKSYLGEKKGKSESFIGYLYLISSNPMRESLKGGLKKIKK